MPTAYEKEERGKIEVKGKGEMTTFWINGKSGRSPPTKEEVGMRSVVKLDFYTNKTNKIYFVACLGH